MEVERAIEMIKLEVIEPIEMIEKVEMIVVQMQMVETEAVAIAMVGTETGRDGAKHRLHLVR